MINIRNSVQTSLTGKVLLVHISEKFRSKVDFMYHGPTFMLHFSAGLSALFPLSVSFTSELDVSMPKMAAISNQGCMCLLHIQKSEFSVSHNHQANVLKYSLTSTSWSFGQDLRNPACLSWPTSSPQENTQISFAPTIFGRTIISPLPCPESVALSSHPLTN